MRDPVKFKIQFICGSEIAMGPGKADLLDAIRTHGSISGGARAMAMSYRRAWLLVDCMNRCWREPLVETTPGVARGGGAVVTALGNKVSRHYRALQDQLADASCGPDYAALSNAMRPDPKPGRKDRTARPITSFVLPDR